MRVRILQLRLIAGALTGLWTFTAGLVIAGYRPGGPFDLAVGLVTAVPIAISIIGFVWPPASRDPSVFAGVVWLGLGAMLLLVPSIGGVLNQLLALGSQTLLPSLEAAYPWLLALAATSLFSGLGLANRYRRELRGRRRRLRAGILVALALTGLTGTLFTSVAIGNELALRDRPTGSSRFGPTSADRQPPACDEPLAAGSTAHLELRLSADVDRRTIGSVELRGDRVDMDFRWTAEVASDLILGQFGMARIGERAWAREPRRFWYPLPASNVDRETVDRQVVATALAPDNRVAAEEHGLEFLEGARARHCRIAIDGSTFAEAFPQIRWLIGGVTIHRWRGQLDYWIFADGRIGQVTGLVSGEAIEIEASGLQATIRARMTATDRDRFRQIVPPVS